VLCAALCGSKGVQVLMSSSAAAAAAAAAAAVGTFMSGIALAVQGCRG
jgi:hypothetical protein